MMQIKFFSTFDDEDINVAIFYNLEENAKIKWIARYTKKLELIREETMEGTLTSEKELACPKLFDDLEKLQEKVDLTLEELKKRKVSSDSGT